MASVGDQGDGRLNALRRQSELKRRFHRQLVKLESQFVPLLFSVLLLVVLLPVTAAPVKVSAGSTVIRSLPAPTRNTMRIPPSRSSVIR